jgi:excinuclease ABC subunit A
VAIHITGAWEHNLKGVSVGIPDGITVVTGVSGSGKSSLVFDTLYHEAHRRLLDCYAVTPARDRPLPAHVDEIASLMPAVAVSQDTVNRNPNSTVATASGIHPFLRLLFATYAERECPHCGGGLVRTSHEGLLARLRDAVEATEVQVVLLRRGTGSHTTLLSILREQSEWPLLVDGRPDTGAHCEPDHPHDIAVVIGTTSGREPDLLDRVSDALKVTGARIVELVSGDDKQLIALAPICPSCGRTYQPLAPAQFHQKCPFCKGAGCGKCRNSGLHPQAIAARIGGLNLREFLALDVARATVVIRSLSLPESASRLIAEITKRCDAIEELQLGYLALDRPTPSLSRGEAQRLRLAVCLASRLEMLHVLDEPTVGLHATDTAALFVALRALAGPVVVVEHDRSSVILSDNAIDLGPGAGDRGGELLFSGPAEQLLDQKSPSGRYFGRTIERNQGTKEQTGVRRPHVPSEELLIVSGARANNLNSVTVRIPAGRLTVVSGVSGSGKTSLVHHTIAKSLHSDRPVNCDSITGPGLRCTIVDQSPIGKNPRSTPATFTKLADLIREFFAARTGLSTSVFSFNRPEGACPTCNGIGANEVRMRYLPSIWIQCPDCEGRRFNQTALDATIELDGKPCSIADLNEMPIEQIERMFNGDVPGLSDPRRKRLLHVAGMLCTIGLGYLELGQPSPTLSGGEAQRIKLAKYLGRARLSGQLLILDEPTTGLHPADIAGLLSALSHLVAAGTTILVVEHNTDLIRAADWIIDLGPGSGPDGGNVLYEGPLGGLRQCPDSRTAQALRQEEEPPVFPTAVRSDGPKPKAIQIRNATVNNLQSVGIDFTHGAMTVVTGVSGSGKSSLVRDVLEGEARRRFLETLSMYERQSVREHSSGEATIEGLGVTIAIDPRKVRYSMRSTVGRTTEIHAKLAVLLAHSGERRCSVCGSAMTRGERWRCEACGAEAPLLDSRAFLSSTYQAACRRCHGVGTLSSPRPEKLITRPELPLCGGAMHSPGFFPNGYLCKPFNGGYYVVQALARRHGFDPATTPWNAMSSEAQHAFLFGEAEPLEVVYESKTGRTRSRIEEFGGFYGWIGDWDVGGTYTEQIECPACGGSGLREESLAVTLSGKSIMDLCTMPVSELHETLSHWKPGLRDELPVPVQLAFEAARNRSGFLTRAGAGYLNLNRLDGTRSAGEAQRVRLASLLGSGLSGLTLLLDEPTRGLHPSEVEQLIDVLKELCDDGNTVIVVEHEQAFVKAADHVVEMGPEAGSNGGRVVYSGEPTGLEKIPESYTGAWLTGRRSPTLRSSGRKPVGWIELLGASEHNLHEIDLRIPRKTLTGICGVSGSGKSTLVIDTLARIVAPIKHTTSVASEPIQPGAYRELKGAPSRAVVVNQSRTGVHSPAVYLKLDDELARIFAAEGIGVSGPIDRSTLKRGCPACGGSGTIRHEMGFMPPVYDSCVDCGGSGYSPAVAGTHCRGISLAELSAMTLEAVMEVFGDDERLSRRLGPALELGLGYLVYHQPRSSLSGGEAQRLKIAGELRRRSADLYLLDEPTVGQHLEDVDRLGGVLHRLVDAGSTVVVVEHHPHLLACCDWLVELGPGAGPEGGTVVAEGPPREVALCSTPTAPYLRAVLAEEQ